MSSAQAYVIRAVELGLIKIDNEVGRIKPKQLLKLMNSIANKEIDYSTTAANIKFASNQEKVLTKQSREISENLNRIKGRLINLDAMHEAANNHACISRIMRNRLSLSKWLLQQREKQQSLFSEPNEIKSLVLEPLARAFENIEPELAVPEKIHGVLSRERVYLESELSRRTSELKDIKEQLNILRGDKRKMGYDTFSIGKFVGQVQSALKMMGATDDETELAKEYNGLKGKLSELKNKVDHKEFERRTRLQLQIVNKLATDWLPYLDTENSNAPISLSDKELTIKVNSNGREDYLWEIGSGANWVSYHVAITLALHQHFAELEQSPVPNYIVYDQPSQVYFPSKLSHHNNIKAEDNELDELAMLEGDEDIVQVQKIFKAFSDAIDKTKNNLQIIVLDHAPSSLVKGIENGHLVDEWRDGVKLVPIDWLMNS